MLHAMKDLAGAHVDASDGSIGEVDATLFDDASWTIRYLVVGTGSWLAKREVLVSPFAVKQPLDAERRGKDHRIDVSLSRAQVEHSPDIDTHAPVSRQHERDLLGYYQYPEYWDGVGLWGMGAVPLVPPTLPSPDEVDAQRALREREGEINDNHLRSSREVIGYDIQASDESIGHVDDFLFDDVSWSIRYLVIDTRNWWPGGRKVLVATHWIDAIEWETKTVRVSLTRAQIKESPEYHHTLPIDRDYEQRLHDAYDRTGYWD